MGSRVHQEVRADGEAFDAEAEAAAEQDGRHGRLAVDEVVAQGRDVKTLRGRDADRGVHGEAVHACAEGLTGGALTLGVARQPHETSPRPRAR